MLTLISIGLLIRHDGTVQGLCRGQTKSASWYFSCRPFSSMYTVCILRQIHEGSLHADLSHNPLSKASAALAHLVSAALYWTMLDKTLIGIRNDKVKVSISTIAEGLTF